METNTRHDPPAADTHFDFLKVSIDVMRVRIVKNLIWIVLAGIIGFVVAVAGTKMLIKNKWTSRCILYKLPQSAELKKEIPSLYEPPDINTVIESVRTRENILKAIKKLNLNLSVDSFYGKTKIIKQKNNNLFTIVAEDGDRETSAKIANAIADIFLASYAEMMQGSANKLEGQYKTSAQEIKDEIARIEESMRKCLSINGITSIDTEIGMNLQKVKDLEMKLLENKADAETAKIRIQDLNVAISQMSPDVEISYVVTPPDAGAMKDLENQLNELTQKFTEDNPKVRRIRGEIEELKKRVVSGQKPKPEQITYGSNQTRQTLEMEKLKVDSELKSAMKNIESYGNEIKETKKSLDSISSTNEEFTELKRRLDLNRQTLSKVENMIATSGLSVKPNSLDVRILEPAVPPAFPDSTKRKAISIAIAIIFTIATMLFIIGKEFLDLTVKSGFDIDHIFKIKNLGSLPDRDKVNLSLFNTSFQVVFENMFNEIKDKIRPVVVFGSVSSGTGKSLLLSECVRIFRARNKRVLVVMPPPKEVQDNGENFVNPFVYCNTPIEKFHPVLGEDGVYTAYFELDENTFSYPIDEAKLSEFLQTQNSYDIVCWELFEFSKNMRLFSAISGQSDLFVLVTRFRESQKIEALSCVKFLKAQDCRKISGLVNCIHSDYFNI